MPRKPAPKTRESLGQRAKRAISSIRSRAAAKPAKAAPKAAKKYPPLPKSQPKPARPSKVHTVKAIEQAARRRRKTVKPEAAKSTPTKSAKPAASPKKSTTAPTQASTAPVSATKPRLAPLRSPSSRPAVAATPPAPKAAPRVSATAARPAPRSWEEGFTIPNGYGDDRLVLLVKDPWWVYAYWEVQPSLERQVRSQLAPEEVSGVQTVLRVYDVTGRNFPDEPAHAWIDVALSGLATSWYVHVNAPDRWFIAEVGLLTTRGRFLTLVRSNRVATPRSGPSDVIDERWVTTDETFWKLFGSSAGLGMGSSPQQLFSPGFLPGGAYSPVKLPQAKAFGLTVDTELIVRDATDPKATVTIQGEPVAVRSDGSFAIRVALPDGQQTIAVQATAADGQQTRTIVPIVSRQTQHSPADAPGANGAPTAATERRHTAESAS